MSHLSLTWTRVSGFFRGMTSNDLWNCPLCPDVIGPVDGCHWGGRNHANAVWHELDRCNVSHWLVSIKLPMILHLYACDDAQNVVEESCDRCGFEAYRLPKITYDVLSVDAGDQLIRSVLSIGKWSAKGIVQIESMMKQASVRTRALQKSKRPMTA